MARVAANKLLIRASEEESSETRREEEVRRRSEMQVCEHTLRTHSTRLGEHLRMKLADTASRLQTWSRARMRQRTAARHLTYAIINV